MHVIGSHPNKVNSSKGKEKLPLCVECVVRVSMDKVGCVFLSFVKEVGAVCEYQAPANGFHSKIALDPGVRMPTALG